MPSTNTSSLNLEKPANGEQDGVWGNIVNANMDIVDRASDGQTTLTLTGTSSTLDVISTNGQRKMLILTGTPSGTHTITLSPNTSPKIYFIRNTTAQSALITQGSGGSIILGAGDSGVVYADGAGAGAAVRNFTDHLSMSSVNITGGTITGTVTGGTLASVTSAGIGTSTADTLMTLQDDGDISGPILTFKNQYRISTTVADLMGGVAFSAWRDTSPTKSYNAAIYAKNTGYPGGAGNLVFATQTNGGTDPAVVTERMRIDPAGNVAIGTVTPLSPLHVNVASGTAALRLSVADVSYGLMYSTSSNTSLVSIAALPLVFGTTNLERMRLDPSGNLGLGAVPSAWAGLGAGRYALQFNNGAIFNNSSNDSYLVANAYYDGSSKYMTSGSPAASIGAVGGALTFSNAPSGTAGGTVTYTERMKVTAAGSLGVESVTNVAGTRGPTFTKGYAETVFALTGTTPALNPANGSIQTWTLTANSTPTDGVVAGESLTLMIDDGTAFTITWPSVTWKTGGGFAPTLNTTGFTAIALWKVGSVLYGARVGDA